VTSARITNIVHIVSGMCQTFCHFGHRDERSEALGGMTFFCANRACHDTACSVTNSGHSNLVICFVLC
jgi:hypothetical protein